VAVARNEVRALYRALLLLPGGPLFPDPELSALYLRLGTDPDAMVLRAIGPVEREWIVFGSPHTFTLAAAHLALARTLHERLVTLPRSTVLGQVETGLTTLTFTTWPEIWWDGGIVSDANTFVHCVAAAEQLLLPARTVAAASLNLTRTFGRHAAVLLSTSRHDLAQRAQWCSDFYRLRSRLLHGEMAFDSLGDEERTLLDRRRELLAQLLLQAIFMIPKMPAGTAFPAALAEAFENAAAHERLFAGSPGNI